MIGDIIFLSNPPAFFVPSLILSVNFLKAPTKGSTITDNFANTLFFIVFLKSSATPKNLVFIGAKTSTCIQFPTFPTIPSFIFLPFSSFSPNNHWLNFLPEDFTPSANPARAPTIGPPAINPNKPPVPAPITPIPNRFLKSFVSFSSLLPNAFLMLLLNFDLNPSIPFSSLPYMKSLNIWDSFINPTALPRIAPANGPPTKAPINPPEEPNIRFLAIPKAAPPITLLFSLGSLNISCVFLDTKPPIRLLLPFSSSTSGPNK